MGALLNLSLRVDKLPKEKFVQGKDGAVYYNFTIGINEDTNQFGQNVTATDSQTKEEREAKKPKSYLGNGTVVWTDGNIKVADKKTDANQKPINNALPQVEEDDLPF